MLMPAITLLSLMAPGAVDSAASRQISASCSLVEERAVQYFEEHNFDASRWTKGDEVTIDVYGGKGVLAPSGKPLSLNRFSIHKYTLHRHLSPLKTYDNFRLNGHLKLARAAVGLCNANLAFEIGAYEFAWPLAVIDDGYPSKFTSNGTLERLYIDAIDDSLKAKP